MAFVVGVVLALAVGLFASIVGLDRDRAFYPVVMIVIAFYYALFAVMGGSMEVLALELLAITAFIVISVAGFKYSLWLVVAALLAHGVFDMSHGKIIPDQGVPTWWPHFCLAYDAVAGLYLACLLHALSQSVKVFKQPLRDILTGESPCDATHRDILIRHRECGPASNDAGCVST